MLPAEATRVIDARGKIVVPGGIETHAHAVANVQPGERTLVAGAERRAARTLAGRDLGRDDDGDRLCPVGGLLRGDLSVTATDSSFTTYLDKIAGRNVVDVRGGNIGIEIRMGVNYTEAVVRRRMSREDFAAVTSTTAAKLPGLYPRKGAIAVGSDADIAIIDPAIKKTLPMADLHVRDYSPGEGWHVEGWPTTVMLRGKVMVANGPLLGSSGDGQLIPRKIDPRVLLRPAF